MVIRIYELRFSNYDCALALKKIKKFGWWSLGILLLAAFIVAMGAGNSRDPFEMVVAGRTNDTSGSWIMVAISNRTQRTVGGYAMCQSLENRQWRDIIVVNEKTGLPGGEDFSVRPRQRTVCLVSAPYGEEALRVRVVRTRKPGRIEALLIKGCAQLRMQYPIDLEEEQILEYKP